MASLYPSWIEIPADDLERALAFYRAVFSLTDTPIYDDDPPARIAVPLPSNKSIRAPGVSLVQSTGHKPGSGGAQINFHIGDHVALRTAMTAAAEHSGSLPNPVVDMGDGMRYVTLLDCEGNTIALSSYEPLKDCVSA